MAPSLGMCNTNDVIHGTNSSLAVHAAGVNKKNCY